MISKCISDNIPPQMKILNMVIPILMHFCSFLRNWSVEPAGRPMKCDVINDVKLFPTGYTVQIFDVIQSNVTLQKQVH